MRYICKICSQKIIDKPSHKRIFCSIECKATSQKNKIWGTPFNKENSPWIEGRKHTMKTKKLMSIKAKRPKPWKKGVPLLKNRGINNSSWKGGITSEYEKLRKSLEAKIWREAVFTRDNYTCIWCGDNKGGNLEADHIKAWILYPELRLDINNGRTLCHNCHQLTNNYGGRVWQVQE